MSYLGEVCLISRPNVTGIWILTYSTSILPWFTHLLFWKQLRLTNPVCFCMLCICLSLFLSLSLSSLSVLDHQPPWDLSLPWPSMHHSRCLGCRSMSSRRSPCLLLVSPSIPCVHVIFVSFSLCVFVLFSYIVIVNGVLSFCLYCAVFQVFIVRTGNMAQVLSAGSTWMSGSRLDDGGLCWKRDPLSVFLFLFVSKFLKCT